MDNHHQQPENEVFNNQSGPEDESLVRETGHQSPPASSAPKLLVPIIGLFLAIVFLLGMELTFNSFVSRYIAGVEKTKDGLTALNLKIFQTTLKGETGIRNRLADISFGYRILTDNLTLGSIQTYRRLAAAISIINSTIERQGGNLTRQAVNLRNKLATLPELFLNNINQGAKNTALTYNWAGAEIKEKGLSFFKKANQQFLDFWAETVFLAQTMADNVYYYFGVIADNWRTFIGGEEKVIPVVDETALREIIKAEILTALSAELEAALKDQTLTEPLVIESAPGQGIVVVPNDGAKTEDQIKAKIRSLFSDEINIQFDASGQAGIITPIFRGITGENYVFVLTPISR